MTGPGTPGGPLQFHPAAEEELAEAAEWYAERIPRLGPEFLAEVRRVAARALAAPLEGAPVSGGRRRLLFERFPYALIYRLPRGGGVQVVAVAHGRRRPDYWRHRR